MAKYLAQHEGISVSHNFIAVLWRKNGLQSHRQASPQALDRTQPLLPVTFGKTEKRTHDYVRHGTANLFAALNTSTGEVTGQCFQRRRTGEFLKFMTRLPYSIPGSRYM